MQDALLRIAGIVGFTLFSIVPHLLVADLNAQTAEVLSQNALDTSETFRSAYASADDSLRVMTLMEASFALPRPQRDSAMAIAQEAAAIVERSTGDGLHIEAAQCWHWVGRHALSQGHLDIAERAFRRELSILDSLVGEDHPYRANSIDHLGRTIRKGGSPADARQFYREALRLRKRYFGDLDHPDLAGAYNNLALLESNLGNYADADSLYSISLRMKRRMYDSANVDLATTINNLALAELELGHPFEARTLLQEGVGMLRATAEDRPVLAAGLLALSRVYYELGRYDSCRSLAAEALEARRRLYHGDHSALATAEAALGRVEWKRGDRKKGEARMRNALAMLQRLFPNGHPVTASIATELGLLLSEAGEHTQALRMFDVARAMQELLIAADHPHAVRTAILEARACIGAGRPEQAASLLGNVSGELDGVAGEHHPLRGLFMLGRGELAEARGNASTAEQSFATAHAIFVQTYGESHPLALEASGHLTR